MADLDIPVVIVGGGGAGLTASMLLSGLGVESLLVSALPTTSVLPKAHLLNQRTMEILSDAGVAEAIYAVGTPRAHMAKTAFYAGFAGWPDAGRCLGQLDAWGGGGADLDWESASPRWCANLPQIRLEPLMKQRAEELAPGRIRFGHEVVSLEQDANGVTVTVRDRESGGVHRSVEISDCVRRWPVRGSAARCHLGGTARRRQHDLDSYDGRSFAVGARPGGIDSLDVAATYVQDGDVGTHGSHALGSHLGGVGFSLELLQR